MIRVNTHEAKSTLSKLLSAVETRDEIVVICRNGKPVAELRAYRAERVRLEVAAELARVRVHGSLIEPLDAEGWPEPFIGGDG